MPPIKYIDGALWQNTHGYLAHKLVRAICPRKKTNSNTNIHHRISNKLKYVKRSIPKTNSNTSPHLQKLFKAPLAQNKHKHRNTFTNKTCQAVYPETPSQAGRSQDWLLIPNPAIVNSNICPIVICNPNNFLLPLRQLPR